MRDRGYVNRMAAAVSQCEAWVDLLVGYAEQVTRTIGGRLPH